MCSVVLKKSPRPFLYMHIYLGKYFKVHKYVLAKKTTVCSLDILTHICRMKGASSITSSQKFHFKNLPRRFILLQKKTPDPFLEYVKFSLQDFISKKLKKQQSLQISKNKYNFRNISLLKSAIK